MAFIVPSFPFPLWLPFLLLIPLLFLFLKSNAKKNPPPGPPKLPIVGHLTTVGPAPDHEHLFRLSKQYGPVMLLQLGRIPVLVVNSAAAAKDVLKICDSQCCSRPTYNGSRRLTYDYLDVAYTPFTDDWRETRKICVMELFTVKRVQSHRSIREAEVAKLVNAIGSIAEHSPGRTVDLSEKLFGLVGSMIFLTGFGTALESTKYKTGKEIIKLLEDLETMVIGPTWGEHFPAVVGWFIDRYTGINKVFDSIFEEVDGFFQQLIDDHLRPGRKALHEDIIDVLLKMAGEQTGSAGGAAHLGHGKIKAVLLDLVLGGIDASAVSMVSFMIEMARNPKILKRAQEEVRRCVGNKGRVSETDLEELHYFKLVMKETLRLHPPVPLKLRQETMSSVKVQGYDVDPKTTIMVSVWGIARDPEVWTDPEEFIPERFEGSLVDYKGQSFGYLPFGSGRRMCPGIYLATMSVELAVANLLYAFDWKLAPGMKDTDYKVCKRDPVHLVPVKYSPK